MYLQLLSVTIITFTRHSLQGLLA